MNERPPASGATVSDLHSLTLVDVAESIRSGAVTSEAVTASCLARIDQFEPGLHSFAQVLSDTALASARQLDQQRSGGATCGPLHGVPIAIKDIIDLAGCVTAAGTTVYVDNVASTSAPIVERLIAAGAVIIGKTQLTEGAYGRHHPDIAAPVNPWHADYWSGVSSSGSGVAVSAGLAFGALGSDTGGSIRFPSAACGLVGLKPTYGRVPRAGVFPLAETLDHIGPMTRSVADAGVLLAVVAGEDSRDATSLREPFSPLPAASDLRGVRIGYDRQFAEAGVDPAVVATMAEAVDAMRELGATVVDVEVPESARVLADSWWLSCGVEVAQAHARTYPSRQSEYGPALVSLIEQGLKATRTDYDYLQGLRGVFRREFEALFADCDCIAVPTMTSPTQTVAAMEDPTSHAELANGLLFTAPFDYSGHPTLTLPMAPDSRGLPRSFQLVAPLLGEASLLAAGAAVESAMGQVGVAPGFR